jgi:mannose-6-phosphate isomerase-like protein (cupin superfamily)
VTKADPDNSVLQKADPNFAPLLAIGKALAQAWRPTAAITVNQANLRVVRFEGHYGGFHAHEVDECYVVLEGDIVVELEGEGSAVLRTGDAYVVRAGKVHRPFAMPRATVLLVT